MFMIILDKNANKHTHTHIHSCYLCSGPLRKYAALRLEVGIAWESRSAYATDFCRTYTSRLCEIHIPFVLDIFETPMGPPDPQSPKPPEQQKKKFQKPKNLRESLVSPKVNVISPEVLSEQEKTHAHSFVLRPELRIQYTYTNVKTILSTIDFELDTHTSRFLQEFVL